MNAELSDVVRVFIYATSLRRGAVLRFIICSADYFYSVDPNYWAILMKGIMDFFKIKFLNFHH